MKKLNSLLSIAFVISLTVNVKSQTTAVIPVIGVSFSPNSGMVQIGTPVQLKPIVTPLHATNTTLGYKSDKPKLVAIDSLTGVATGLLPGSATITAKTLDGNFKASYKAIVYGNELKLPAVLSNNMVLQQDMLVALWGWGSPNESLEITASWGQTANATADATGKWSTKIQTPKAVPGDNQTKHTLTFKGKNNIITLSNLLIGDVYICSGQSNMEFPMSKLIDAKTEIAAANFPNIRINKTGFSKEIIPVEYNKGDWSECSAASVSKFSAVAYYFARELHSNANINIPIGLIESAVGGSSVQSWIRREALDANPELKSKVLDAYDQHPTMAFKTASTILYNAMIAPITPFSLKGFLWYQGESNNPETNYRDLYSKLLSTLITDWRTLWGQGDIPFYFVQLPAHVNMSAEMRNQQSNTLTLPNTGMAVTLDLSDADLSDIHPHNKKDVGIRLAKIAEAKIYNQNVVHAGPMLKSFSVKKDKIRIKFQEASIGSGLASRDGQALSNFEIAGSDNKFVPATAIINGNDVVVYSPSVKKPVNVAFAYIPKAIPNLMNKEGLTAFPFRTDTWNYSITLSNKKIRK
jgi:sialate O-acetylesterase